MDPHTTSTILVNAPITFVWGQLWENFLEESDLTKGTNITKKKADEIHRTVTINEQSHKENIVRHAKQKTVKNQIVDGNLYGQYTYEVQQSPKGEVFLKLSSNILDENKKLYPPKAALDYQLAQHKERIQYRQKHPKKSGICC